MNFNARVDEAMAQAEIEASVIPPTPAAAPAVRSIKKAIKKGRLLLEEHQKLICLANHSEHGWGVVDENTTDDLTEDSDDERILAGRGMVVVVMLWYGGDVVQHGPCVSHSQWSAEEVACSLTWRELSAVCLVLLSVAHKLVNTWVHWFTDNQNVGYNFTS